MTHYNFHRSFNRKFNFMFFFVLAFQITVFAGIIIGLYFLFTNPAAIGEFFGKIVAGFNSTH